MDRQLPSRQNQTFFVCDDQSVANIIITTPKTNEILVKTRIYPSIFLYQKNNIFGFIHKDKPSSLCNSFFLDLEQNSFEYNICCDFYLANKDIDSVFICINSEHKDKFSDIEALIQTSKTNFIRKKTHSIHRKAESAIVCALIKKNNKWFYSWVGVDTKNKNFSGFVPVIDGLLHHYI